jgi:hypothetical protein
MGLEQIIWPITLVGGDCLKHQRFQHATGQNWLWELTTVNPKTAFKLKEQALYFASGQKKTQNHHPPGKSSFYRCPRRQYDKAHRQTLIVMADSCFLLSKLDMNKIIIF